MLVKIISCQESYFWYKDKIGQVFDVIGNATEDDDLYQVVDDGIKKLYLMFCDVKPLKRKEKFERIMKDE